MQRFPDVLRALQSFCLRDSGAVAPSALDLVWCFASHQAQALLHGSAKTSTLLRNALPGFDVQDQNLQGVAWFQERAHPGQSPLDKPASLFLMFWICQPRPDFTNCTVIGKLPPSAIARVPSNEPLLFSIARDDQLASR